MADGPQFDRFADDRLEWVFYDGLAGEILSEDYFGGLTPTLTGQFKVWTGAAWVLKPVKVWIGSSWAQKPVKRWNGAAWVLAP